MRQSGPRLPLYIRIHWLRGIIHLQESKEMTFGVTSELHRVVLDICKLGNLQQALVLL